MTDKMKQVSVTVISLAALAAGWCACSGDYFVDQKSPGATDTNCGSEEQPFKTITKACATAKAGDTVFIKAGTYREALIPKNSGEKDKPITFQAYKDDFVMIKGSEILTGLEKEGDNLWVKRPWTKDFYWNEGFKRISEAPYRDSARIEQVFVNEAPMQWCRRERN